LARKAVALISLATVPVERWTLAMFTMHKMHRVAAAANGQPNDRLGAGHGFMQDHAEDSVDRTQE
jgi:hypothetical protein